MTGQETTILIVDDDASIRKALSRLMMSVGWKAKTYESAREFLDQGPPANPGCLLLDVRLPGLSGLDLQTELTKRNIETPIIFMTGHGDIPMTVKAMQGGAVDFLTKPFEDDELLSIIKKAIQVDLGLHVARAEKAAIRRRLESLTPREREVMHLVVKGLMNKEIADVLGAALKTVKVHRGRVMKKMGVQSVVDLIWAFARVKPVDASSAPHST